MTTCSDGSAGDMLTAGITSFGGSVTTLELPAPRALLAGEVLIEVHACGVGNWDEIVRIGGWDIGVKPPMALGVQAAGAVSACGDDVHFTAGDRVITHQAPVPEQGAWASHFIARAADVAQVPAEMSTAEAGALPVPALTADQALTDGVGISPGQSIVIAGAGGVTGGLLVALAVHYGAHVFATASLASADRVSSLGAQTVLDYHQPEWPARIRDMTGGGADAAVNAARAGAQTAMQAVRDGGRLATITGDPPDSGRGISVADVVVTPDGDRLARMTTLAALGKLTITVARRYRLDQAAEALAQAVAGSGNGAVVITPATS